MDYNKLFSEINNSIAKNKTKGKVASYIPELSKINPAKFGVHLTTINNKNFSFGDSNEKFSIQSISKVLSLTLAYSIEGEKLWNRVGVEPSGTPFNSLVLLEHNKGIPRNPLINSGAIVICDILVSKLKNPKQDFLKFIRELSGNYKLNYCLKMVESEKNYGFRNVALVNLMKSFNNIENDIDVVMDFYYNLCSIEMTCQELSRTFLFLTTYGTDPISNKIIISESKSKLINAIIMMKLENLLLKLGYQAKVVLAEELLQYTQINTVL